MRLCDASLKYFSNNKEARIYFYFLMYWLEFIDMQLWAGIQ
ncbi:hypothetical protein P20311_2882 [Pseudoalteromonas sp. BSi20311]|nr:hypothetical protein P20311_2882 [Pseudoalteromonas sp. BSi20311]